MYADRNQTPQWAKDVLNTIRWDRGSYTARLTVDDIEIAFRCATDDGEDVVLHVEDFPMSDEAGRVRDAPFDAEDVEKRMMEEATH